MCIFIKSFLWSLSNLKRNSFCPSLFWVTDEVYLAYYSKKKKPGDDRVNALLPQTSTLAHMMEELTDSTYMAKVHPFSKLVSISKLCKHVPLLLFYFHAYGLFTNWKIQTFYFCSCGVFFFSLSPPPPQNIFAPLQSAFQHSATYCKQGQDN